MTPSDANQWAVLAYVESEPNGECQAPRSEQGFEEETVRWLIDQGMLRYAPRTDRVTITADGIVQRILTAPADLPTDSFRPCQRCPIPDACNYKEACAVNAGFDALVQALEGNGR